MDGLMLVAIAGLALILMLETRRETDMHEFFEGTIVGAIVGSALSVWWRKPARWLVQFAAGIFLGWWGGDYFISFFALPDTIEAARFIGATIGLIGYSIMEQAMTTNWGALAGKAVEKAAQMRGVK
jgi:hypothetical protein